MVDRAQSIEDFILELRRLGINIWVDDNRLRSRAPKGAITATLRSQIKSRKDELIAFLSEAHQAHQSQASRIQPVVRRGLDSFPLSFTQESLWLLSQIETENTAYNEIGAVRLEGDLQVDPFQRALTEIVHRHEALRTTFSVTAAGEPTQVINPPSFEMPRLDLSQLTEAQQKDEIHALAKQEAQAGFDLEKGPLFRCKLLRLQTAPTASLRPQGTASHVLLMAMHHLIGDVWSMGLLIQELSTLYGAFVAGKPSPLPNLPIQYADYASWQRLNQGDAIERHLNYWKEHLADAPALLQLPTDHARPSRQTFQGSQVHFTIAAECVQQLRTLAQQTEATLFMVLLTSFKILLFGYSQQKDIVIGAPIANRQQREVESLIGFFVNTIVFRTQLAGNQTFLELLAQVKQTTQDAYAHQDISFATVVSAVQPERDLSYAPLFQVMFAFQNIPTIRNLQLAGLRMNSVELDLGISKYDLSLELYDTNNGLSGTFEYNLDLFEEHTMERMAGHFQTLLSGIVANPLKPIAHLPLLTETEKHQLLVEWNDTAADYPSDQCIHQLFEQHAERTPEAIAVVFGEKKVTYQELNARANQLAHYLIAQGVGPDVLVGICVERSIEMVVGLLGILKAGGAYVPLEPDYPSERLAFMLSDTKISLLLTQSKFELHLPPTLHRCDLDVEWPLGESHNPRQLGRPNNLAYVMYTSGSTGRPKGVLIEHQNVVRLVQNNNFASLSADEVFLQLAPISFDASTLELWGALLNGAKLVVMPPARVDLSSLLHTLVNHQITTLWLTAGLFHLMVDEQLEKLGGLRQLLAGGDVLSVSHVKKFLRAWPDCQLINGYGPTENTTFTTCCSLRDLAEIGTSVPIGRPIANTQVYILDQQRQPVPVGVVGELYAGGAGVARGYLNRPQLTKEKFIPNPFGEGRLYKTGDLCRYQPDTHGAGEGLIEFLGRSDYQVKIRGFRIELGEIETALNSQPTVREAVVVMYEDSSGVDKRLVAYIIIEDGIVGEACAEGRSIKGLRAQLSTVLPDYMIPSAFVELTAMPLTPNGKIDRRALPAPEIGLDSAQQLLPRTPVETILAAIWQELLGVKQVGIHDNFFEIGGHSLLATQVVSRIRQSLQVELPLRRLWIKPTIAELASQLTAELRSVRSTERALPPLEPYDQLERPDALPLSFAQQRLWFLAQFEATSDAYNIPCALRLDGPLDLVAFSASWQGICERHEALRTTFPIVDGRARQQINPANGGPSTLVPALRPQEPPVEGRQAQGTASGHRLDLIDLSDLPTSSQEAEVARLSREFAKRPFDLLNGPLWRMTLLRLGENSHVLLLSMHHIISDGWSIGILMRELSALYAQQTDSEVQLPNLPVQYADFALWQREWFSGDILEQQLAYWKEQLADAPPLLSLPTDHPRPAVQSYRGSHLSFTLPKALTQELKRLSVQSGTTLFMTLQAAFALLLSRYSGQKDILIGTPIANRQVAEVEELIGFFVNTLVLRNDLSGDPTFRDVLTFVRQVALDAYQHQALPFELLVEMLQLERSLSHSPLFQVMFTFSNNRQEALSFSDVTVTPIEVEYPVAKFDLTLAMQEREEGLIAWWEYNTDLFKRATIERMAGHFQTLLEGIIANPLKPIALLPLLTEAEGHQLLREWNETTTDYPNAAQCIHQLFEAQVERTPDAIAVVFDQITRQNHLTYRELNQRANQLAHYLIKMGVGSPLGAERLVGICMPRSLSMVVGLLGILKAGGAYVPLDPSYPKERLAFMLQDANLSVLLTEEQILQNLPSLNARTVCWDREWSQISKQADDNLPPQAQLDNLAYIIYTSGSTGLPKGVMVTHKGLSNLVLAQSQTFAVHPDSRVLQFASLNFDASISEIGMALCSGAQLCLVSQETILKTEALLNVMQQQAITHVTLPPSYLTLFTERAKTEKTKPIEWLPDLETLIVAGEACPPSLVAEWAKGRRFFNAYGPTEATVCTTIAECDESDKIITIGRPMDNVQVYILNEHLQPVPIGIPGELCVGGVGVARGYLNRPLLTSERFIPNPFGPGRLYKTGDLCRYLPESSGNIEFIGRIDHQIKLRGFRIELGEIEAILSQHPAVQETTVILREDRPGVRSLPLPLAGQKQLVAYVVKDQKVTDSTTLTDAPYVGANELRTFLKQKVPDYMVPSAFVFLENMPLTPNGKVDRRALPAPLLGATKNYVSPQSDLEQAIADVWQELLNLPKAAPEGRGISIHDNFFEIGGHSLLAIQVHTTLQALIAHAKEMTITDLFRYPTIASLAQYLSSQIGHGAGQLESEAALAERAEAGQLTQSEALLSQSTQSRSQARRKAFKRQATRKPKRRRR